MRNRGQKLTEKQKNNLHRIKRKYHISKTSKLKEIKEKLHQRVNILSSRAKKARLTNSLGKKMRNLIRALKDGLRKLPPKIAEAKKIRRSQI